MQIPEKQNPALQTVSKQSDTVLKETPRLRGVVFSGAMFSELYES
jgi:hypothetical protein